MFRQTLLCFSLCPLALVLAWNWTQYSSRCGLAKAEVEGKDHLPRRAGNTAPNASQNTINLGCLAWHIQVYLWPDLNVDV